MRLGISPYGSTKEATFSLVDEAVAGGIDTFWLGDGLFRRPDFAQWRGGIETMTLLAHLAGRHPGIAVGITAAVLPVRDLDWLAREANTLDLLTEGRFVLAVAAGFWADELAYRGLDPDDRGPEFRRRLDQLQERLAGERLSPEPHTPGGPPVWLAGAAATRREALRRGLPFQASRATPAELAPIARQWFDEGGGLLAHRCYVEVGDDVPDGEQLDRHVVAGPPEALAEGIAAFADLGVGDLSMVLGHDDDSARRTLEALAGVIA